MYKADADNVNWKFDLNGKRVMFGVNKYFTPHEVSICTMKKLQKENDAMKDEKEELERKK